jgi:hypothetical protein
MLVVALPDGSSGTVAAVATDMFGEQHEAPLVPGTVLTGDGVRRLRALLAVRSRGRGSRGTRRRAA